jgi:hypothetical protein
MRGEFSKLAVKLCVGEILCRFFIEGMMCNDEYVMRYINYANASKIENFSTKIKEYYQVDWFANQTASWNGLYQPTFTEVLTKRGYGFAFNMLPDSKLFTKK